MFLLIFLLIFFIGIFTAYRLLWPEMYVKLNRPDFNFLWKKPHLRADITHEEDVDDLTENELPRPIVDMPHEDGSTIVVHEKIEKLGTLLFEKNKLIERLQIQLESERSHRKDFENVKIILDEEIKHLREQLKAFRNYYKEKADA